MKTLENGDSTLDRIYYYLLDFKYENTEIYVDKFGDKPISYLTKKEVYEFFKLATNHDLKLLEHEQENF